MIRILFSFSLSLFLIIGSIQWSESQSILQQPVATTIAGLQINPLTPTELTFLFNNANQELSPELFREEIDYFFTALSVPGKDLWVNLSPHEPDRVLPKVLAQTKLGYTLLQQDLKLKELSVELLNPEHPIGKRYWNKVYQRFEQELGSRDQQVETFHRIWIVPEKSLLGYRDKNVIIEEATLTVLLETDFISKNHSSLNAKYALPASSVNKIQQISDEVYRQIILPEITQRVNQSIDFLPVRKIYHATMLATWFKEQLNQHYLSKSFANQKNLNGLIDESSSEKDQLYTNYVEQYYDGVFNFNVEEFDFDTQSFVQKSYFSGGIGVDVDVDVGMVSGVRRDEMTAITTRIGNQAKNSVDNLATQVGKLETRFQTAHVIYQQHLTAFDQLNYFLNDDKDFSNDPKIPVDAKEIDSFVITLPLIIDDDGVQVNEEMRIKLFTGRQLTIETVRVYRTKEDTTESRSIEIFPLKTLFNKVYFLRRQIHEYHLQMKKMLKEVKVYHRQVESLDGSDANNIKKKLVKLQKVMEADVEQFVDEYQNEYPPYISFYAYVLAKDEYSLVHRFFILFKKDELKSIFKDLSNEGTASFVDLDDVFAKVIETVDQRVDIQNSDSISYAIISRGQTSKMTDEEKQKIIKRASTTKLASELSDDTREMLKLEFQSKYAYVVVKRAGYVLDQSGQDIGWRKEGKEPGVDAEMQADIHGGIALDVDQINLQISQELTEYLDLIDRQNLPELNSLTYQIIGRQVIEIR